MPRSVLAAGRPRLILKRALAYAGHLARLALGGGRADVTLAMLVNLDAWGAGCLRLADALRADLGDERDEGVAFLDFFAVPPPPSLAVELDATIAQGLAGGESPERARAAAPALQAYELMFWDAMDAVLG